MVLVDLRIEQRTELCPIQYYKFIIWVFQVNLHKLKCGKTNIRNICGIFNGIFIEKLVQLRLPQFCVGIACSHRVPFKAFLADLSTNSWSLYLTKFCRYIAQFIIPSFPQLVNITEFNVESCNSECLSNNSCLDIFVVFELGSIRLNFTIASKSQFVFHTTCTHFQ